MSRVDSDGGATARSRNRILLGLDAQWVMVLGLWMLVAAAAAYEIVPASVTPIVMDELAVGPVAAGWLVSIMLGVAVVTSIPIGVGLDRADARLAIGLGAVALIVAGVWGWKAAAAGAYAWLMASRVLGALAYTTIWNASANIIGRSFDVGSRATAIGVFTSGGTAGFALGQLAGPLVADALGWAWIFGVFGALAGVGIVVFWGTSGRIEQSNEGTSSPDLGEFGAVLTDRRVWHVCVLGLIGYALFLFFLGWMPTYLAEEMGLSLAQSGTIIAVFTAIGMVSRTSGGVLSDRLFETRRRPVAVISFVVTAPIVAAMVLIDSVVVVFGLLLVAGFFIQLAIGLFFTYVRELVNPNVAATAIAVLTAVGLFGGFASPIVAGALIGAQGFLAAFAYAGVIAVAGVVLAWFAPEPNA